MHVFDAKAEGDGLLYDEPLPHRSRLSRMASSFFWRRAFPALLITAICALASSQTFSWSNIAGLTVDIMSAKPHQGPPTAYAVVPGIFIQDDPDFNEHGYDSLKDSFGLIDKSPQRWTNLTNWLTKQNAEADQWTSYKLLFIARHGEGVHNQAEQLYGTEAWDCYWSLLNTDGNLTWGPDALLNEKGISDARKVNLAWKEKSADNIPLPESLYSSPLRRAASTLKETWHDILLDKGVTPHIKEALRETIGMHTCDQRSDRSVLEETYPGWILDPDFSQHDQLWNAEFRETNSHTQLRVQQVVNEIFATDPATVIGLTSHGGAIEALLKVLGHRPFSLQTAGVVPVVVKATWDPEASTPVIVGGQSLTASACAATST